MVETFCVSPRASNTWSLNKSGCPLSDLREGVQVGLAFPLDHFLSSLLGRSRSLGALQFEAGDWCTLAIHSRRSLCEIHFPEFTPASPSQPVSSLTLHLAPVLRRRATSTTEINLDLSKLFQIFNSLKTLWQVLLYAILLGISPTDQS